MLKWTNARNRSGKKHLLAAFGLAAASWFGGTSVATDAAAEDLWRPYFELENRGNENRYTAQANLFVPVFQNTGTLVFADLRAQVTDQSTSEGNFGVAMRTMLDNDKIFGAYGFYDIKESPFGNTFQQGVVGFELLSENSGARINGYIPDQETKLTGGGGAVLFNNNIFVQAGVEAAYWGVDVEYEKRLFHRAGCGACGNEGSLRGSDVEIWASAGVFHFDNHNAGFREITGPRFRTELRLYDLPFLGNDSRFVLSGQYEYDGVRDGVGTGLLNVRIPFGKGGRDRQQRLYGLDRRMVAPIVRDVDVVTNSAPGVLEQAKIARTGQVVSQAVVIDANTVTPENVVAAAGNDSVVIADGAAGVIMPGGSLMLNDGQVLMSGGGGLNVVGCVTGTNAVFNAPFTRAMINTGMNTAVQAADNSSIIGVDLLTTGNVARGVILNDDQNVLIDNSTITTSGNNGNSTVNNAFGIETLLGSTLTVANSATINTSGASFGAIGLISNGTSQNTLVDSSISTAQGLGIGGLANSKNTLIRSTVSVAGGNGDGIQTTGNAETVLVDSTINIAGTGRGIVNNGSTGATTLTNSTVNTTTGNGINMAGGSTGATTLTNSTVNTTTGNGIFAFGTGATTLTNSRVNTTTGTGIIAGGTGATTLTNSRVNTTGANAIGILGDGDTPHTISLTDSTVTTAGANAHAIQVDEDARLTVLRGAVTTTGAGSNGIVVRDEQAGDDARVLVDNVDITTTGVGIDFAFDTFFNTAADGSLINATIRNNRITAGVPQAIRATTTAVNSVYNLSFSGNTLTGGLGQILLDERMGVINVEQTNDMANGGPATDLDVANGIPNANIVIPTNPVTFGAAAPATP